MMFRVLGGQPGPISGFFADLAADLPLSEGVAVETARRFPAEVREGGTPMKGTKPVSCKPEGCPQAIPQSGIHLETQRVFHARATRSVSRGLPL